MNIDTYKEYNTFVQNEINNFRIIYAYTSEDLENEMIKHNIQNKSELIGIYGGGVILKKDLEKWNNMFIKFKTIFKEIIETSDIFLQQMFDYELCNLEYVYNQDDRQFLETLGFEYNKVLKDKRIMSIFLKCKTKYLKNAIFV